MSSTTFNQQEMDPSSPDPVLSTKDPETMKKPRAFLKPDRNDAHASPAVGESMLPLTSIGSLRSPIPMSNTVARMGTLKQIPPSHVDTTTNDEEEDGPLFLENPLNVSQSFSFNTSPHPKTKSSSVHSWQKSINIRQFMEAADKGKLDIVKMALENHKEWINEKRGLEDSDTPLIKASYRGHFPIVEFLIQNYQADIDMNKSNDEGETALYKACDAGHEHIVDYLLTHGCAVDQPNKGSWTPLCEASRSGHLTIVELLIKHQANINIAVIDGKTPMYFAAANDQLSVLKCLLANGADINKTTDEGITPLCRAAKEGYTSVVAYLISQGADMHRATKSGQTPLHVAAENRSFSAIRSLLLHGNPPSHTYTHSFIHIPYHTHIPSHTYTHSYIHPFIRAPSHT